MAGTQTPCTIPEAVEQALIEMGTNILERPEDLVSQIKPLIGEGPSETCLLQNCDRQLLAPYAEAVLTGGSAKALQAAAVSAADVLASRDVDEDLAQAVGGQIMAGVARALNGGAPNQRSAANTKPASETPQEDAGVKGTASQADAPTAAAGSPTPATGTQPTPPEGAPTPPASSPTPPTGAPTPPTSSPTPREAPPKQTPQATPTADAGKKKLPVIPIVAGIVAVVLVGVLVFLFLPKPSSITFEGDNGAEGATEPLSAMAGETVTLPENGFTRDGYEFAGWVPSSARDSEPLAPGTQVSADDATSYVAVWKIKFTFDGNGADGGETAPIFGTEYSEVPLPECGFTRKGYLFAGWTTNKDDGFGFGSLKPGDTYIVGAPTTFYATWVTGSPVVELSIKELDKASTGNIDSWNPAVGNCGVVVTNDTGKPVQLKAEFVFTPAAGGDDYKTSDFNTCLAAGDKTLIVGMYAEAASKVTYSITAENPYDFAKTIGGHFSAEVDELSPEHVALNFKNTDADKIELQGVPCLLTDQAGNHFIAIPNATTTLEKGKTTKVVFDDEALLNKHVEVNWEECDREYFLKAYVSTI